MGHVTSNLVLTMVAVKALLADEIPWSSDIFTDDYGPVSDLSLAFVDPSSPSVPDSFSDLLFPPANSADPVKFDSVNPANFELADPAELDYFQPDESPGLWDDGLTTLLAGTDDPSCGSVDSQLPSRLRVRAGTCAASSPSADLPVLFDLSDPNLKLKPICPIPQFPFYTIPVCSSGNPLDEWGPLHNVILYNSVQGKSGCSSRFANIYYVSEVLRAPSDESCRIAGLYRTKETLLLPQTYSCGRSSSASNGQHQAWETSTFFLKAV